jgi:fucose 4-O-acetylase-like acetyltransferase
VLAVLEWLALGVALLIWIAIAFWLARVARRKGHSFLVTFLFALVFLPLALVVVYFLQDRTAPRADV